MRNDTFCWRHMCLTPYNSICGRSKLSSVTRHLRDVNLTTDFITTAHSVQNVARTREITWILLEVFGDSVRTAKQGISPNPFPATKVKTRWVGVGQNSMKAQPAFHLYIEEYIPGENANLV